MKDEKEVGPAADGGEGGGRYAVVATLARGDVRVNSFPTMTEAILYTFEVESLVLAGGFRCPPMRVEMTGGGRTGVSDALG